MKKIYILFAVVVLLALLPLVGNKVVKQTIQNRLDVLNSYGVATTLVQEEKGYLKTQLHYTLQIEDEKKFMLYLQQFASNQIPPYTSSLLDGVEVGVDVVYSNIPFNETIAIDLYPTKLSLTTMNSLKKDAPKLYGALQDILKKKEILYHIDYEAVNGEFSWYLKDFHKSVTLQNNAKMQLSYEGVKGSGKGILVAPEMLTTNLDRFQFHVSDDEVEVVFLLQSLHSTAHFESKTTYIYTLRAKQLSFETHNKRYSQNDMKMVFDDIMLNGSMNTQQKDAQIGMDFTVAKIDATVAAKKYSALDVSYQLNVDGLEKDSFIKLQELLQNQTNPTPMQEQYLEAEFSKLAVHGLHLKLSQKVKTLLIDGLNPMDGFHILLDAKLAPSTDNIDINGAVANVTIDAKVLLSKPLYTILATMQGMKESLDKIKKEQNDTVEFDISFAHKTLKINGEVL